MSLQLLDHFHPPLSTLRHWESFHARWAAAIADALNDDLLPAEYFAEVQVHVGSRVEVDVGTFTEETPAQAEDTPEANTATAMLAAPSWAPPEPAMHMPAVFPDSLEVLVFHTEAGPTLVAAIELISPGNNRAAHRRAFAAKCCSYLQQGIGLMIVDIVTNRQANLHNAFVGMLDAGEQFLLPYDQLYTTAYRPVRRADTDAIDVWPATLAVGRELPIMPLPVDATLVLPLNLGTTYDEACQRSRLPSISMKA